MMTPPSHHTTALSHYTTEVRHYQVTTECLVSSTVNHI